MKNISIYSSLGKTNYETKNQNSISLDFQSVTSSCITKKDIKEINSLCSPIRNFYHNINNQNSITRSIFNLNILKNNIKKNKNIKHYFLKTKSCDSILPNISENQNILPIKNNKNLKISINSDCNIINNTKNIFFTLNKSNFSTTTTSSQNIQNKSKILNIKKALKKEHSYASSRNGDIFSLHGLTNICDNYYNIHKENLKRENLYEYFDKTKKIILYKFAQNELKKLVQMQKEKIETNLEQHDLNYSLLKKLLFLFKKYAVSFDTYFFHIKEEIRDHKKNISKLIEIKKELNNEIFALGNIVYRIKNRLKDYLNNKYFLLSVKNHTNNFDYFSSKDQHEFKADLFMFEKVDEKLSIILDTNNIETNDTIIKSSKGIRNEDFIDNKKYSLSHKNLFQNLKNTRKKYYSQKSVKESLKVKKIFSTPKQFMKDLDLISKGINNSLKVFNKLQNELLDDKQKLSNLNKQIFENENIEKEFDDRQNKLLDRLNTALIYNNYLRKNKNLLISKNKTNNNKKDLLLNKIRNIINNINKNATKKMVKFLNKIEKNKENHDDAKKNEKLKLLKIIEEVICFLQNKNDEFKKKEKEKYLEIEENVRYISHLNNFRKNREKDKLNRTLELLKILKKNNNLLFIPNKKNYFIKSSNKFNHNNNDNKKKNVIKMSNTKTISDIDLIFE